MLHVLNFKESSGLPHVFSGNVTDQGCGSVSVGNGFFIFLLELSVALTVKTRTQQYSIVQLSLFSPVKVTQPEKLPGYM